MKIGILTYHRAYNYGAFLQAYALKQFLCEQGHEVDFIDYWPKEHMDTYRIFMKENCVSLKMLIRECVLALHRIPQYKAFKICQQKFLGISVDKVKYTAAKQLDSVKYDYVIYGSDQIWWKSDMNVNNYFDKVYWGDYISNVKKVAYAPSMGIIDLNSDDKAFIKDHLQRFDAISVREEQLSEEIFSITQNKPPVVLDPTLLVDLSFWNNVLKTSNKKRYILLYQVGYNNIVDIFAKNISNILKLPVVKISSNISSCHYKGKYLYDQNPFDFVSLVKNAEFVISKSFHGVAFSIIFNKNFYALGMENNSGRVYSLLRQLGIEDRLLSDPYIKEISSIDYSKVNQKLDLLRESSKSFLLNALKNNHEYPSRFHHSSRL